MHFVAFSLFLTLSPPSKAAETTLQITNKTCRIGLLLSSIRVSSPAGPEIVVRRPPTSFADESLVEFTNYRVEKSRLENNQGQIYKRSQKQQEELVAVSRRQAAQEIERLLRGDTYLQNLPDAAFERVSNKAAEWGIGLPVVDLARFSLYLIKNGIDPYSKPSSFADLFRQFGITKLYHKISFEGLIQAIKKKALLPG